MTIRHVITIEVTPGRVPDFAKAFKDLQQTTSTEEGCRQYELFRSLDDPNKVVILEAWASRELLEKHTEAEAATNAALVEALIALWEPGTSPTVERFEVAD